MRQWWSLDLDSDVLYLQFTAPQTHTLRDQLPQSLRPVPWYSLPNSPPSPSSEANSKWLDAHYDPMANIHTFSACLGESLEPRILGSEEKEESDNGSVGKPLGF